MQCEKISVFFVVNWSWRTTRAQRDVKFSSHARQWQRRELKITVAQKCGKKCQFLPQHTDSLWQLLFLSLFLARTFDLRIELSTESSSLPFFYLTFQLICCSIAGRAESKVISTSRCAWDQDMCFSSKVESFVIARLARRWNM